MTSNPKQPPSEPSLCGPGLMHDINFPSAIFPKASWAFFDPLKSSRVGTSAKLQQTPSTPAAHFNSTEFDVQNREESNLPLRFQLLNAKLMRSTQHTRIWTPQERYQLLDRMAFGGTIMIVHFPEVSVRRHYLIFTGPVVVPHRLSPLSEKHVNQSDQGFEDTSSFSPAVISFDSTTRATIGTLKSNSEVSNFMAGCALGVCTSMQNYLKPIMHKSKSHAFSPGIASQENPWQARQLLLTEKADPSSWYAAADPPSPYSKQPWENPDVRPETQSKTSHLPHSFDTLISGTRPEASDLNAGTLMPPFLLFPPDADLPIGRIYDLDLISMENLIQDLNRIFKDVKDDQRDVTWLNNPLLTEWLSAVKNNAQEASVPIKDHLVFQQMLGRQQSHQQRIADCQAYWSRSMFHKMFMDRTLSSSTLTSAKAKRFLAFIEKALQDANIPLGPNTPPKLGWQDSVWSSVFLFNVRKPNIRAWQPELRLAVYQDTAPSSLPTFAQGYVTEVITIPQSLSAPWNRTPTAWRWTTQEQRKCPPTPIVTTPPLFSRWTHNSSRTPDRKQVALKRKAPLQSPNSRRVLPCPPESPTKSESHHPALAVALTLQTQGTTHSILSAHSAHNLTKFFKTDATQECKRVQAAAYLGAFTLPSSCALSPKDAATVAATCLVPGVIGRDFCRHVLDPLYSTPLPTAKVTITNWLQTEASKAKANQSQTEQSGISKSTFTQDIAIAWANLNITDCPTISTCSSLPKAELSPWHLIPSILQTQNTAGMASFSNGFSASEIAQIAENFSFLIHLIFRDASIFHIVGHDHSPFAKWGVLAKELRLVTDTFRDLNFKKSWDKQEPVDLRARSIAVMYHVAALGKVFTDWKHSNRPRNKQLMEFSDTKRHSLMLLHPQTRSRQATLHDLLSTWRAEFSLHFSAKALLSAPDRTHQLFKRPCPKVLLDPNAQTAIVKATSKKPNKCPIPSKNTQGENIASVCLLCVPPAGTFRTVKAISAQTGRDKPIIPKIDDPSSPYHDSLVCIAFTTCGGLGCRISNCENAHLDLSDPRTRSLPKAFFRSLRSFTSHDAVSQHYQLAPPLVSFLT